MILILDKLSVCTNQRKKKKANLELESSINCFVENESDN
jgi:hypothetical protein